MLRKLMVSLLALVGTLGMLVGTASASIFLAPPSTSEFSLGSLPTYVTIGRYRLGGNATLTNNGSLHDLSDLADIWQTTSLNPGTSFLTGVNLLDNLFLTASNNAGNLTAAFTATNPIGGGRATASSTPFSNTICPTGCLGGTETYNGQMVLSAVGTLLPFPLTMVGIGGTGALPIGQAAVIATGGPFVTGKVIMTGITENIIRVTGTAGFRTGPGVLQRRLTSENVKTFTTANGFASTNPGNPLKTVHTITMTGTNGLASASAAGTVTLISPLRIQTGPLNVGTLPAIARKKFVFGNVPEPGTMLLLVSGAAGLVFIGRKRMKS